MICPSRQIFHSLSPIQLPYSEVIVSNFLMPLVKIKGKYQITIPAELREKIDLEVGDLLEANVEDNKITFTPKKVVDREIAPTPVPVSVASSLPPAS